MPASSIALKIAAFLLVLGGASLVAGSVFPALRRSAVKLLVVGIVVAAAAGLIR